LLHNLFVHQLNLAVNHVLKIINTILFRIVLLVHHFFDYWLFQHLFDRLFDHLVSIFIHFLNNFGFLVESIAIHISRLKSIDIRLILNIFNKPDLILDILNSISLVLEAINFLAITSFLKISRFLNVAGFLEISSFLSIGDFLESHVLRLHNGLNIVVSQLAITFRQTYLMVEIRLISIEFTKLVLMFDNI